MSTPEDTTPTNFIRNIIEDDLKSNKHEGRVVTRFPPEPSGYLHLGHSKPICLNFGVARDYQGQCYLRFDDTNPEKEEIEYVESMKEDIRWLGFDWEDRITNASDYFEQIYDYAVELIQAGKAFVCSLDAEQMREYRGTLQEPGKDSPDRERSIAENLDLFARMRAGEFEDGKYSLRAKIDMTSPNINMRDPVLYRIRHVSHHATGDKWCIYPTYDFTHCICDALENITHSLCTLEFEDHRPLYDWILDNISAPCHPQQIEFSRLNLDYMITSKRKLKQLVEEGSLNGWDDPRMPTIAGARRRGITPAALRDFNERVGITKKDNTIELGLLEYCIREDLNENAPRAMAVLKPLRVVIENYPEGQVEDLEAINHPQKPEMGTRTVPFSKVIYIERDDFMEDPPKKFFRLGPGREVRLRYAYFIKCVDFVKDPDTGEVVELRCTYDPETRGGNAPDGRKVKGTIHWVSAEHAVKAEIRLYDRLFTRPDPEGEEGTHFTEFLNPESLEVLTDSLLEPDLAKATLADRYQFERQGYFCLDKDSKPDALVFNRTVTLRDTWAKVKGK